MTVAAIPAAGNSGSPRQYVYTDNIAAQEQTNWYYRLKMIDLDGKSTYSATIIIRAGNTRFIAGASPNPFTEKLRLIVETNQAENALLTLTDMRGMRVKQQTVLLQKGSNIIWIDKLGKLSAGLYQLSLTAGASQQHFKLIKQ